jgi:uncharacterized protein YndB with AHSA1/START domain
MSTFIWIVVALLIVAVVVLLARAAGQPDAFGVRRSVDIAAPPEKIFPLINDLHAQSTWSPFEKDPNMKRTHSGAPLGKGAVYEWDGNRTVGSGRIAIVDSAPPSRVTLMLDMFRPFKAHNTVVFTLEPQGGSTRVTWAMQGAQPYMAKLMTMFIDCDKMVGSQFEEGLGKLKILAERQG